MAIPSTGNISIKSAAGSGRSIDAEMTAVSSGSLVSLSTNAVAYGNVTSAPYGMREFAGYSHGSWGTNTSPTTNLNKIYSQYQEDRSGGDTCVVTSCNMILNTGTKTVQYSFTGSEDFGGRLGNLFTTNGGSISYSGIITSLEARFVHVGQAISIGHSGSNNGRIVEMFSNNGHLSSLDVNNNNVTGSIISNNNDISSGPSGTYRSLRTTTGNMSVAMAVMSDDANTENDYSHAKISYDGSDSLTIQLRMNGSIVANLYQRTGTFEMESETSEEGTS